MRSLFFLLLYALLSLVVSGQQSPSQLLAAAAPFAGLSDEQVSRAKVGLLGELVWGYAITPAKVATFAAPWNAASDNNLRLAKTYLLNQIWTNSNPSLALTGVYSFAAYSDSQLDYSQVALLGQCFYGSVPAAAKVLATAASWGGVSDRGLLTYEVTLLSQLLPIDPSHGGIPASPAAVMASARAWAGHSDHDLAMSQVRLLALIQANNTFGPWPVVKNNTVTEVFPGGTTNTLLNLRTLVAQAEPTLPAQATLTLSADAYHNDNATDSNTYLTNMVINGNGHVVWDVSTNTAIRATSSQLCFAVGTCEIDNLIYSNVLSRIGVGSPLYNIGATNITVKDSKIYGYGLESFFLIGVDQITAYATNVLFYDHAPKVINDNSYNVLIDLPVTMVMSNCTIVTVSDIDSINYCPISLETDPKMTNCAVGCSFITTNNPLSKVFSTTNALCVGCTATPYYLGLTNCFLGINTSPVSEFDRSNQQCTAAITLGGVDQNKAANFFVGCTFNLAYGGGTPAMLGNIVDQSGGALTDFGPVQFINCTVIPAPGSKVIFFNNGFPVSIHGGNLTSANFSEPLKVTTF